jgi:segregation and condensation protein B
MELTKHVLEAILFAADQPLSVAKLAQLSPKPVEPASLQVALEELAAEYEGRAVELRQVAGGWQFCTRPEYGDWVRKFLQAEARQKLSRAALETLAIIVYRQPITKTEIEALRGVDSSGVLKTLLERRLVKVLGRKRVIGRPILYGSSREFLQYFGLNDLTDLPRTEDLELPLEGLEGHLAESSEALSEALALAEGALGDGDGEP